MPNPWHLLLWPWAEGELGRFMQRLSTAHLLRWQAQYHEVGLQPSMRAWAGSVARYSSRTPFILIVAPATNGRCPSA